MNNAQKIHQLSLFALISALAVGGVAVASYIQGSNPSFVAGTPSAKSLVFSDGTDSAIPLVLKKNVGEIHGCPWLNGKRKDEEASYTLRIKTGQNLEWECDSS